MKRSEAAASVWVTVLALLVSACFASGVVRPASPAEPAAAGPWPRTFGRVHDYSPRAKEGRFSIARRFGVSLRSLTAANASRGPDLPLRVPGLFFPPQHESSGLVLNIAERVVYVYGADGAVLKAYPVAVGRPGWETPTGNFTIVQKRTNPTWFPPAWAKLEKPVPPGPGNPLGDRWMGLSVPGYGIHATNSPRSIGTAASHGCVRMYPEHAHDLYNRVARGTPVRIVYETILLGYSGESRALYLSVHPDIYRKGTNQVGRAQQLLDAAGVGQALSEADLLGILREASGVPFPVLGSDLRLVVDGKPAEMPFGPTLRGGLYLVPAGATAAAIGASLSPGAEEGTFLISRAGKSLTVRPGSAEARINGEDVTLPVRPVLVANRAAADPARHGVVLLVPLGALRDAFGATVEVDRPAGEIRLFLPPLPEPALPPIEAPPPLLPRDPDVPSDGPTSPVRP